MTAAAVPAARSTPPLRFAAALVLFFLSPFVAEFLLGNISISAIAALLFLAPMYGGGAIVVREVARRCGRGWPTIVLLALAYGLLEEGIIIQTLFNPHYLGLSLLQEAFIPALGIGGWWTPFVLTLHTVWSISVPIAVTEALFPKSRETPWLGKIGLAVTVALLLAGSAAVQFGTHRQDPFHASAVQLLSVVVLIVAVVVAAFRFRRHESTAPGAAPQPLVVGAVTFLLGLGFMSAHAVIHGWAIVGVYLGLYLVAAVVITLWSRRPGWSPMHTLAAGGGAMLTYACTAFPQVPVVGAKGTVDLIGNTIFAAIALGLLFRAVVSERRLAAWVES